MHVTLPALTRCSQTVSETSFDPGSHIGQIDNSVSLFLLSVET